MMENESATLIHHRELQTTFDVWKQKPLIRAVYRDFYQRIQKWLAHNGNGFTVEIGAGFAGLKSVEPKCIATDLCSTPWIDRAENVYQLSFDDSSLSNLVMMDVFHHLEYPGDALAECLRVLVPRGRLLIFEPDVGMLGWAVYGMFHDEPLAMSQSIRWHRQNSQSDCSSYYAAQGNAYRVFLQNEFKTRMLGWQILCVRRYAALSYVLSGGFRKRQLYPLAIYPMMKQIDRMLDLVPWLSSTRMLVVLENKSEDKDARN